MRKESLVLQYRQLQKREIRLVNEKGGGPLEPSVRKMEAVITEKTNTDLMHEIAKAVEPALTGYLKHHTPFRQRAERRRQRLRVRAERRRADRALVPVVAAPQQQRVLGAEQSALAKVQAGKRRFTDDGWIWLQDRAFRAE